MRRIETRPVMKIFESLRIRNYRLFLTGQFVSFTGTWMAAVALAWLVLDLTGSGLAVGITLGLQFGPIVLLGMWAGTLADRSDKRTILIRTQSAMAVIAATLWLVTVAGAVEVWMLYTLTFLTGSMTAIDHPTRQSFVSEMVGAERVSNAVSLNSAVFNASRIIGPALAALIISTIGLEWTFLLNALSYTAVVVGLKRMDGSALLSPERQPRRRGQVIEGLRYAWSVPRLRYTLGLEAVVATFGLNFSVMLPLFARFVFDEGAGTLGVLTSMMAGGALLGALVVAGRPGPTKRWLVGSAGAFGVLTIAAALAPSSLMMGAILVPLGAMSITFISTTNSMLQLHSRADMRGRVMALHGIVFLGSTPIGAPLVGWWSEIFGPRVGLAIGGAASLAAATVAALFVKRVAIEARIRRLAPSPTRKAA